MFQRKLETPDGLTIRYPHSDIEVGVRKDTEQSRLVLKVVKVYPYRFHRLSDQILSLVPKRRREDEGALFYFEKEGRMVITDSVGIEIIDEGGEKRTRWVYLPATLSLQLDSREVLWNLTVVKEAKPRMGYHQ